MNYIYFILNTIKNNKVKYFITLLSVTISIGSVLFITTISTTSEHVIKNELKKSGVDSISVRIKGENGQLNYSDVEEIRKNVPEAKDVTPVFFHTTNATLAKNKEDIFLWGIDEDSSEVVSIHPIYGRNITKEDSLGKQKVCVVDKELALKVFHRENITGKTIQIKVGEHFEDFKVVGIMDSSSNLMKSLMSGHLNHFIYIPHATMQDLSGASFNRIGIRLDDGVDEEYAKKKIESTLQSTKGRSTELEVENLALQKETIDNVFSIITTVLTIIASISMLISGLMIMSLMVAAVGERTAEIGIKKALGATREIIMQEFLLESVFICFSGFAIGFFLLLLLKITLVFVGIPLLFRFSTVLFIFCLSVIMGAVFGVYPAYKAANLNPVDAFRK